MEGLQFSQLMSYGFALGLAALIPGPGMTALMTRTISGGVASGFMMLVGLIVGDLIYLSLAIFGVALVAKYFGSLFIVINWASAIYLAVLAWQFWHYQSKPLDITQKTSRRALFSAGLSGLTITLGNPKTIAFYLAIVPFIITPDNVSIKLWGMVLVPTTVLILIVVGGLFVLSAMSIRHLLTSVKAQVALFRFASVIMLLAAIGMVAKTQ